jgi:hypothetical protein
MSAGILLLVGFLVMAQELFSESVFGVPHEPDEEAARAYMDEERSTSSSSTPIGLSSAQSGSANSDNNGYHHDW